MAHLKALLETDLPIDIKEQLISLYLDELTFDLSALDDQRDSSITLQKKCTLLYLLALLGRSDAHLSRQLLEQLTVPLLQKVTFASRFPIQEKYFACLYFNLLLQVKEARAADMFDDETIDLQLKTRVFQYAFSGLSSKLEIISRLSSLVLAEYKVLY